MKYAGAQWIRESFRVDMSPLGEDVANLLGRVFLGIYHLPAPSLKKVDWSNTYYVEYILGRDLSTVDFDHLSALVVYAHDMMLRITIEGVGPGYVRLLFHKRHKREGGMSERCPTIADHIFQLRERGRAE